MLDRSAIVTKRKTVLVCDDDRLVLLGVTTSLRQGGFDVIEADNGDDAILLARQHLPDLAVLDIRMDGKSGLDVAAYLRDFVGTPFIFLSAYLGEDEIRQAREFGALECLDKPIDPAVLVSVVGRCVGMVDLGGAARPPAKVATSEQDCQWGSVPAHWVAAGLLMARHGLDLPSAMRRLKQEADVLGVPVMEAARRLIGASREQQTPS